MKDREILDGLARLRTAWDDRGRLAWLPWPVAALALVGVAKHFFEWVLG